jgi:hypothetical protein
MAGLPLAVLYSPGGSFRRPASPSLGVPMMSDRQKYLPAQDLRVPTCNSAASEPATFAGAALSLWRRSHRSARPCGAMPSEGSPALPFRVADFLPCLPCGRQQRQLRRPRRPAHAPRLAYRARPLPRVSARRSRQPRAALPRPSLSPPCSRDWRELKEHRPILPRRRQAVKTQRCPTNFSFLHLRYLRGIALMT